MKNDLDDETYRKRQRLEMFSEYYFFILAAIALIFTIIKHASTTQLMVGVTMSFVLGLTGFVFRLSRFHRQEHKQLYVMLVELRKPNETDAQQPQCRTSP